MNLPVPLAESYWVLPGRLLAGPYAGSREVATTTQKLGALLSCGVTRFINLTQVDEVGSGGPVIAYERALYDIAKAHDIVVSYHRLPITEGHVPTHAHMRAILTTIRAGLAAGETIYLHCRSGHGRTGLVVGCLLVENGSPRGAVLEELAGLRSHTATPHHQCPELGPQTEMVRWWGS